LREAGGTEDGVVHLPTGFVPEVDDETACFLESLHRLDKLRNHVVSAEVADLDIAEVTVEHLVGDGGHGDSGTHHRHVEGGLTIAPDRQHHRSALWPADRVRQHFESHAPGVHGGEDAVFLRG